MCNDTVYMILWKNKELYLFRTYNGNFVAVEIKILKTKKTKSYCFIPSFKYDYKQFWNVDCVTLISKCKI